MVVLLLFIFVIVSTVTPDPLQGYSYRFTSVKCSNGSALQTTKDQFCYIKNFSRNLSTINFGLTVTRPLNIIYLKYSIDFKYGAVFRNIINPPVLEWCAFYKENSKNVLLNTLLDMIRDSTPGLLHNCPYQVRMLTFKYKIFEKWNHHYDLG